MERSSSTSMHENFVSSNSSLASEKESSDNTFLTDTPSNSSLYDSAVENLSAFKSFNNNACANNNTNITENLALNFDLSSSSSSSLLNSSSSLVDNNATLNNSTSNNLSDLSVISDRSTRSVNKTNSNAQASLMLIQSESNDTNTSQEEVDPKSELAIKTIFKSDNPNLSIIEISDDMHKANADLENSVLVIEKPVGGERSGAKEFDKRTSTPAKRSPSTLSTASSNSISSSSGVSSSNGNNLSSSTDTSSDKRRKKQESLLQSSKQKLNIAIAEASAKEHSTKLGAGGDAEITEITQVTEDCDANSSQQAEDSVVVGTTGTTSDQLQTRREIKIYDSIKEFEENLPSTVTILDTPFGSKVYLVGTAHFSEDSQDDVSFVIRNVRPDVVMVELCPSRVHILKLDERTLLEEAKNINLAKIRGIIQSHGYINGIFFIMLLQMSAQIAKDLGVAPGGEFRRAFEEIQRLPSCMLHLGDRPIRITLHRALRALSYRQIIKLVLRLLSSDSISIEEVEESKQGDLLEKLMQEMAGEFPAFSDVFVTERDLFLCHSLQVASLPQTGPDGLPRPVRVVGVIGIGHAKGIAKMWGHVDPQKIPEIMKIPPTSLTTRVCAFTLKYGFIGLTLFGAYKLLRPRLTGLFR